MKAKELIEEIAYCEDLTAAKRLAKNFLVANAANPSGKMDIFKFTDKNHINAAHNGVLYDAETHRRVATDGATLIALADGYDDTHAGKILLREGQYAPDSARFPNYKSVIPSYNPDNSEAVDVPDLIPFIKDWKAGKKKESYIKLHDNFILGMSYAERFETALKALGTRIFTVGLASNSYMGVSQTEKGLFLMCGVRNISPDAVVYNK